MHCAKQKVGEDKNIDVVVEKENIGAHMAVVDKMLAEQTAAEGNDKGNGKVKYGDVDHHGHGR